MHNKELMQNMLIRAHFWPDTNLVWRSKDPYYRGIEATLDPEGYIRYDFYRDVSDIDTPAGMITESYGTYFVSAEQAFKLGKLPNIRDIEMDNY